MINNGFILVNFFAFLVMLIIIVVFFTKKRVNMIEDRTYGKLLIAFFITIFVGLCSIVIPFFIDNEIIIKLFNKFYIIGLLITIFIFSFYTFSISHIKDKQNYKMSKIIYIILFLVSLIILLLPISVSHTELGGVDVTGPSINFGFSLIIFNYIVLAFLVILDYKNIYNKKYVPIFALIFEGIIFILVQIFNPTINYIFNPSIALSCLIMYFTIENPDMKIINQLEVAKDQADKANRAKTDFLSSMSHEIRTPLNAIVGFSDCIIEASTLDEAKENALDIVNASQTLLEIVNGILDISKIEAGKLEIVNSPYDAPSTFLDLAKLITPKMNEKGLDFTFNIAPDLPNTLYGDHANLKKIVTNLLSNACKYTERGFVHYEVNCVNSNGVCKLVISVEDSGRGIKKESVDKLFTKFQRLDEDRNTTIEGTGLGLAITKQLIELMGGRIIVHTVYGEGSKFTVVLNQKIEATKVVEKKIKNTLDLSGVKILMVDDTPLNLKVGVKLLEKYGADSIVSSPSGFDCLDRIKNGEVYDIILLDDMMPKMSGVETLRRLKEIPGFKIPTIALTANAITGMREKYLADGFDDFLAKPIEKEQLISVMNQILGRSVTEDLSVVNNTVEKVEEKAEEEVETLEVEEEKKDLIPVVDINTPTNETVSYDKKYLEDNGVDMNHALELLGDMDMYNMTINDFVKDVENKWNRIVDYKDKNDMENYAIEVHSLKSDCKYLGFMTLADIAYQHELKSKENDSNFVNDNFNKLEEEYKKVLVIANTYAEHNKVSE